MATDWGSNQPFKNNTATRKAEKLSGTKSKAEKVFGSSEAESFALTLNVSLAALLVASLQFAPLQADDLHPASPFAFRDVAEEAGVVPAAAGIQAHGAGWGDVDGDGWAELYVGTFHYPDTQPSLLLRNREGRFVLDEQPQLRISTRATGVLFADLDNDGDLDLYVGSMPADAQSKLAVRTGHPLARCSLFRNDGSGRFADVSGGNGACPKAFGGRSATVLDYDGDGLLDLKGTYAVAVDPAGDKLYITWNVSRGSRAWDCCSMTVVHIPESERN